MKRLSSFIQNNPNALFCARNIFARTILLLAILILYYPNIHSLSFTGYHTNSISQEINTNYANSGPLKSLLPYGNIPNSLFHTGSPTSSWDDGAYIEITIKDGGLSQSDQNYIVVYTRRLNSGSYPEYANDNPIAFHVKGQFDNSNEWQDLNWNVYFLYRGASTDEYSSKIPIKDIWTKLGGSGSKLTKLRFYVVATQEKIASGSNYIPMGMNRFDVLKVGPNDNYTADLKDNFHLATDYRTDLSGYKFRHTQGIFDDVNWVTGWEKINDAEKAELKSNYGIEIPNFEMISNNSSNNKPLCELASGHQLQPTHEVEHILYAMPGDIINLYPYYELYHTDQFYENFSHWYDYRTGGHVKYPGTSQWSTDWNLLDFLTEPEKIQISNKEGFFAGYGMAGKENMHKYDVTSVAEYIAAVTEINTHKEFSYININAPGGLDFNNRTDIPMLGDGYAFKGIINGNGTTIKNLKYDKTDTEGVGLIGRGGGTVVVKNLILDKSCTFIGQKRVGGIVGLLNSGNINISDIKTEATVYATVNASDQNAAGILGAADGRCTGLKITNCYIGGTIGNSTARSDYYNAAVCAGWWGASDNSSLRNIVVGCNLIAPDNNAGYRYYVRHNKQEADMITLESGIKSRGGMTFENCYGDLQTKDGCWKTLSFKIPNSIISSFNASIVPNNEKWNVITMTPPMTNVSNTGSHTKSFSISTTQQYIDAVNEINGQKSGYSAQPNAYIEIAPGVIELDFNGINNVPMIGSNNDYPFSGHFNGNGCIIKGLNISGGEHVGMFARVKDGAVIENLIIDNTCSFTGTEFVGLIGRLNTGTLTVNNIRTEATVIATKTSHYFGTCAGGILGVAYPSDDNKCLKFKNIYVGGYVSGGHKYNAPVVGFLGNNSSSNSQSSFTNIFVNCSVSTGDSEKQNLFASNETLSTVINCYSNLNKNSFNNYSLEQEQYITEWTDAQTPAMTGIINSGYDLAEGDKSKRVEEHKPGTVATFYCPKNPYDGLYQSLPFPSDYNQEQKEYIIAADFSKTFALSKHLDIDNNTLSEPIIAFRHIFRIRDGKEFADKNFGSYTGNRSYIRDNQKMVSARCGVPFQIRLTTPVPVTSGNTVPTNIYYKKSENEYGRVCGKMEIILLDGDTREVIKSGDPNFTQFSFGDEFEGIGQREIEGVKYSIGDGNNKFYRMLKCTPPDEARHYKVQLVATENPNDPNKRINVYHDPVKDADVPNDVADPYLIIAEYDIRFLPLKGATMLTMDALYDKDEYAFARVETLEEKFGKPIDVIDFDEYININTFDNTTLRDKLVSLNETKDIYGNAINPSQNSRYKVKNGNLYHSFFKWPIPWNKANYAYGFNYRDGYNMYLLATHSDQVAYKQAVLLRDYYTYGATTTKDYTDKTALLSKDKNPIKGIKNADYHGKGLYDVKYYRTKRQVDEYYKLQAQQASTLETRADSEIQRDNAPEMEQGYFYWGNAASDPGVATRLEINDLCHGSTIHVSAWISEFSIDEESTNLSFNFVAVMKRDNDQLGLKQGDRIVLHSFVTGYVPDGGKFYQIKDRNGATGAVTGGTQWHWVYNLNSGKEYYDLNYLNISSRNNGKTTTTGVDDDMRGQWLNVYYSFVPRLAEFGLEDVTSDDVYFELELDNNAKSSKGADFGIDDIRIYLEAPAVEAMEMGPACAEESVRMVLGSPFETLLEIAQKREKLGDEKEELDVYYTYLNKSIYDKTLAETGDKQQAFEASNIIFNYNRSDVDDLKYGKITFNSNYSKNIPYPEDKEEVVFGKAYSETKESGQRMIVFESDVASGKLKGNQTYYVIFKSALDEDYVPDENELWYAFDLDDQCVNKCEMYVIPPLVIRKDGEIQTDDENITTCEGHQPVLQVDINAHDKVTNEKIKKLNVNFDWFYGTKEEYIAYNDDNPDHLLSDALTQFRLRNPNAENLDNLKVDEVIEGEKFEPWMLELLKKVTAQDAKSSVPKLTLYGSSYTMPPAMLNEDGSPATHTVTVVPIACIPLGSYEGIDSLLICSEATSINITVNTKSPIMKHGLSNITYPESLIDVPIRIGIDQLKTNLTESNQPVGRRRIDIPVRIALSSDGTERKLKLIDEKTHKFDQNKEIIDLEKHGAIVLVKTNDPEYKDLGTIDKDNNTIPTFMWVGDVQVLNATTDKKDTKSYFQVEFESSFNFKEGYYYSFRIQYEEEAGSDTEVVCNGQDVFTIKVVPKYLAWTGTNSLNYNDDGNWRRVGKTDLFMDDSRANAMAHYVTNGYRGSAEAVNPNLMAYAPLDFTRVIVEKGMEAPFMYPMSETEDVKDEYQPTTVYSWPYNPEKDTTSIQNDDPGAGAVGKVTDLIHYDMAAFEFNNTNRREMAEIGCRPWYANTCKEIHFKPGGTIMNQQELIYQQAWVDMELDHSRWYTVSSPLKEAFAGDFYLPSNNARQKTELYEDITFDNDLNITHRFKPAVFQRSWDKSEAKVYEIDGPAVNAADVRNVAVKTFWSHVYNDVIVPYGGGVGFSIKTDVSNMDDPYDPDVDKKVLFRLPKADSKYKYWNKDGSTSGHETTIARTENQYRLNDGSGSITVETATEGKYFLVGNPFMTHMDIKIFLEKNEDKLEPNYWIVTEKGQIAGSVSNAGVCSAVASNSYENSFAAEPTVIPPMQGFFVESKISATSLSLEYDKSMMRRYDSSGKYLTSPTRAEEPISALKISSYNYGVPSSAALLLTNGNAYADNDVEAMDNRELDILSTVYTAKGGKALSINFSDDAEGTEIGIIADDDTETVLRFEGVEAVNGLYLLDKADHSLTPLEEGMEVTVEGTAAGRFFLTYGIADEGIMSGIEWNVGRGVLTAVDNAASGHIEVNVYDTMGRPVKHEATTDNVIDVQLESGIYVVEIATAKERETAKIRIAR